MDLRQLEYFSTVVREGTYTAAAARLHVAQPALWKQVNDLERELGVGLFERVGRRVRPTPAGLILAGRAEQILGSAEQLRLLAHDLSAGRTGRVRVRCFAPHIARFLAATLSAFRRDHPSVAVELVEHGLAADAASMSLLEVLRSGTADVIATSELADARDLVGVHVYDVHVAALGRTLGSARRRRTLPLRELDGVPLVVSPRGYFSRDRLEAACLHAGFTPRVEAESSSPAALIAMADNGIGVAVVADDAIPSGRDAVRVTVDGGPLADEVWLYRLAGRDDPAADAFLTLARGVGSAAR